MAPLTRADLLAALPDVRSTFEFPELQAPVVIRRDRWGIPHIKATNAFDLFFGQGFATAQDRLFQMDLDRLRAQGRAAEYLGPAALQQDAYLRRRGLGRVAKLDAQLASAPARTAIEAYAAGVNAYLGSGQPLPVEYRLLGLEPEPWEAWHCVAIYKVRNTGEGYFQGKLWTSRLAAALGPERAAQLSPAYLTGGLLTVPPGGRQCPSESSAVDDLAQTSAACQLLAGEVGGSNAWVLGGAHTRSGLPLLAGDPHRGLETPNVYYQTHLIGGGVVALGFAVPGMPMVLHFAHNEHVAWGMTFGALDTQDLFVERFRSAGDGLEHQHRDGWKAARVRKERLRAWGGPAQEIDVVETTHGPVIAGEPRRGYGVALADPGSNEATPWLDAAYDAMTARSADEFERALDGWTDRVNNYVYADTAGAFGYRLAGRIPVRPRVNSRGPVPGWTGAHEWQGLMPPSGLPRARNPAVGWAVTCNQRIGGSEEFDHLSDFAAPPYRAERVAACLTDLQQQGRTGEKADVAALARVQCDTVSAPMTILHRALERAQLPEVCARAVALLRGWDGRVGAGSAATALLEVTGAELAARVMRSAYGPLLTDANTLEPGGDEHWRLRLRPRVLAALAAGDETWAPGDASWPQVLTDCLLTAWARLEQRFGPDPTRWRWGDLHRAEPSHPMSRLFPEAAPLLDPPSVGLPGDQDTVNVAGWRIGSEFRVGVCAVARYVHDPADWSRGSWISPLGSSGRPGSPHYADQQGRWARGDPVPQIWDWRQVSGEGTAEQTLRPGGSLQEGNG